ncbi:hypothetical protein vseg_005278 [Gypsophila vaccaria]
MVINMFIKRNLMIFVNSTSKRLNHCRIHLQTAKSSISTVAEIRHTRSANAAATILSIGTSNPPNIMYQKEYPDFYFAVNNCQHMTDLKYKFERICEKSGIRKRHMYITEDLLKQNPLMCNYNASSLDSRQEILRREVPKLAATAAMQAIAEWGQSVDKITHLIFCTMSSVDMPGADYHLARLLDLPLSVNRFMLYHQGCYAGGTALRLAKDIAENNRGARVLVVCSEMTVSSFRGPTETHMGSMVAQALFGDGSGAVIIGTNPDPSTERPIFEILWASQTMLANSGEAIEGHLNQVGLHINLHKDVPKLLSRDIRKVLVEAFDVIGLDVLDWNSVFWVAHPGGPAILDELELELGLGSDKLIASRYVLSEFGNMSSACVLYILDEMRRRSFKEGKTTTGEGLKWGVLLGFGPGVTVETVVLRSVPI